MVSIRQGLGVTDCAPLHAGSVMRASGVPPASLKLVQPMKPAAKSPFTSWMHVVHGPPDNALCPAGQAAHRPPACEPWRAGQGAHAPPPLEELPAGQGAHAVLPAADELPGAQGVHAALPAAEELPALHGVAEALPAGQKLPAGHVVQAPLLLGEKVPAAQAWQLQGTSWLPAEQLWEALEQTGSGQEAGAGGWGVPATEAATWGHARGVRAGYAGISSGKKERIELTAVAVDQRVARAAVEAGPAGACCVAQQAVRPLSRAPLRHSKIKLCTGTAHNTTHERAPR